jgi:hypothetical protein
MITPLYNGLAIFGPAPHVRGRVNPLERRWSAYPAINGRLSVIGGSRGSVAVAAGVLAGVDEDDLKAQHALWEAFKLDGGAYFLYDCLGKLWPAMILIEFDPEGEVLGFPGGVMQEYSARFESTI